MAKFCPKCGTEIKEGENFCSNCGNSENSTEQVNTTVTNLNQLVNQKWLLDYLEYSLVDGEFTIFI